MTADRIEQAAPDVRGVLGLSSGSKMSAELTIALERMRSWWDNATPEQQKSMHDAQRESWIRAMGPCEHGDFDWETCAECRAAAALRAKGPGHER